MKSASGKMVSVIRVFLGLALAFVPSLRAQNAPLFQYAVFYNGLMEFSDCPPMTINAPVFCNSNIYVGCISSCFLTFKAMVSCTGTISDPPNAGYPSNEWTGPITYKGTPAPGYQTNAPEVYYLGTNAQQILYPPTAGENPATGLGAERYYNKAAMTIWISNVASVPVYTITLKNGASDPSPVVFTNLCSKLTNNYFPWLTVTNTMYDWREMKTNIFTQIDVGKLSNWMYTNIYVYNSASNINKFNSSTLPLNIIWVGDWRYSNSTRLSSVRLTNGATLPPAGLTVATPNPLYIAGIYNCPILANMNTTNVSGTAPASVACDALTILSSAWSDPRSFSSEGAQTAVNDTVNAAILTGNVPSTANTATNFSGGVANLPRLQENWTSKTLTLNTSFVCLFSSSWATGQYLLPTTYYSPPTRAFYFNQNYNYSTGLPPGTPLGRVTAGAFTVNNANIQPNGAFRLSFNNSPGQSFTVLGSTNPFAPLTNWTIAGSAIEVSPGQFQFTDLQATNLPQRFYKVRSP